jgi:hypothetical protein
MKQECAAPATASQKEVVRLLSIEHGHKRAAELTGVPYDVVRQWSVRGKWRTSQNVTSRPVSVAIANVQSELENDERETRASLSRYARKASKEAESVEGLAAIGMSQNVHNVAKTAAIVHRWDAKEQQGANVVVNVALLGIDPSTVQAQTIDVDSGVSE